MASASLSDGYYIYCISNVFFFAIQHTFCSTCIGSNGQSSEFKQLIGTYVSRDVSATSVINPSCLPFFYDVHNNMIS